MRKTSGLPDGLSPVAHAYLDSFPPGEIVAFPIHDLDRTGVSVWVVALFLSPNLAATGAMPLGIGYGLNDGEALLGALGEVAEDIHPTLVLKNAAKTRGSYNELARAVGKAAIADPLRLGLPAGSPVGRDSTLEWIEARRARDDASVLVPVDIAASDRLGLSHGYEPFTTPVTNGLGAGKDLDWAIGHGLLEILQRDGNGLNFRALDQGIVLQSADSPLLDRFAALGIRAIPKFATDDFGLTNLYIVGYDEPGFAQIAPISISACGEACHPDRGAALEKAALEFAAARVRKAFSHSRQEIINRVAPPGYTTRFLQAARFSSVGGESRALTAMLEWTKLDVNNLRRILLPTFAAREVRAFTDLPNTPVTDARQRGHITRTRVEAAGFDVLYIDCSPAGREVAVVKVIVPGLEVETMSYHRLGYRNAKRLIERDHAIIRFGKPTPELQPVRMTPEEAEALGHPLFDIAAADRIVGPLYPLYREPELHHVAWSLDSTNSNEK